MATALVKACHKGYGFSSVGIEKDGLPCTEAAELDGKTPGLPTGATHTRRVPGHCTPAVLFKAGGKSIALLLQTA